MIRHPGNGHKPHFGQHGYAQLLPLRVAGDTSLADDAMVADERHGSLLRSYRRSA